jgi:YebC/PmpR family DNA-binding regulatory protein
MNMSGHSKWTQIKRQKGVADQKRGNLFTKLAKNITIAAKSGGGDPAMNFKLRLAIDQARSANMPKDNIERAIKRGTGELGGEQIEEIIYEGFGPGGTVIIIATLSDNKNRTVANIKHILAKHGGRLGSANSVLWQFEKKGVIRISNYQSLISNFDDWQLQMIDAGVDDIQQQNEELIIYTKPDLLQKIKEELDKLKIQPESADLEFVPKEKIKIDNDTKEKLENCFAELDNDDDINNYYTNAEM